MSGSELFPVQKFPSIAAVPGKLWEVFCNTQALISWNKTVELILCMDCPEQDKLGRRGEIKVGFLQAMPDAPNASFPTPRELLHQDPKESSAAL